MNILSVFLATVASINSAVLNYSNNDFSFEEIVNLASDYFTLRGANDFKPQIENVVEINGPQKGFCIDFIGDNGYLLLDSEKRILNFSTIGDYHFLQNGNELRIDNVDLIIDGKKAEAEQIEDSNFTITSSNCPLDYDYIEYDELLPFVNTKYSSIGDFSIFSFGKLPGLSSNCSDEGYLQSDDSVYWKFGNGTVSYEGNCGLTSTSNALAYYSRHGGLDYVGLPSYNSTTLFTVDTSSSEYLDTTSATNNYLPISLERNLHTIYYHARAHASEMGYRCYTGLDDPMTTYVYEETAYDFGFYGSFLPKWTFSLSDITEPIDNGIPVQLRTISDDKYKGHGMMITGYRTFRAYVYVGRLLATFSFTMVSVFDGHSQYERWYDLTYLSNLGSAYSRATTQSIAIYELSI